MRARIGFVVEQALGHVAYGQSLRGVLERRDDIEIVWMPIPYEPTGLTKALLLRSNWTLRGSLRARQAIVHELKNGPLDALFLHTQTISLFAGGFARRIPTLLSLDATPINLDTLAGAYEHNIGNRAIERLKKLAIRRVVHSASLYTTWSEWAKTSLVEDYGAEAGRVTVVHPGTNLANYPRREAWPTSGRLKVLFVGGDFPRKGGDLLLDAVRNDPDDLFELHLVTATDMPASDRVHVYHGLRPHSAELLALYNSADVFALPTRGDCLAVVLGEAMAAGLPIITTPVGAHAEVVRDGHNGWIMQLDDGAALLQRLQDFARDRESVQRMGQNARNIAEAFFDIERCANTIGDLLSGLASSPRPAHVESNTNAQPARRP